MKTAERFLLHEDTAINEMADIIHEIYRHDPKKLRIVLTGAVDEVPTVHVEYDANVLTKQIGEKY